MKPRVPETFTATVEAPICPACARTFLKAYDRANRSKLELQRLNVEELLGKSREKAKAIKFNGEWVCVRCTSIPQKDGTTIPFWQAYPNREARRAAKLSAKAQARAATTAKKRKKA
jgi:hypothetical protein